MQDRFYALLKRRLRAEIEKDPPLFPWESQLCEYADEPIQERSPEVVAAFWMPQLEGQATAAFVPEPVLASLLSQCQSVMQGSLRRGEQLVRVVEQLFPSQSAQTMHQIAGWVLAEPVRSATLQEQADPFSQISYDDADPDQKIALAMLAAQHVFNALTLELTPSAHQKQYEWQTALGALILQLNYHPTQQTLTVQATLPCEGHVSLEAAQGRCDAVASGAGSLLVGLCDVAEGSSYRLQVAVDRQGVPPLEFSVRLSTEA